MMYPGAKTPTSPRKQQGVATILIIILVGLGLTATTMGIMHSVKSTQQKQLAVHAVTHSQAGAWVGVEIFRKYLISVPQATVDTLALNTSIEFQVKGTNSATIRTATNSSSSSSGSSSSSSGASNVPSLVNIVINDKVAPTGTAETDFYKITATVRYTDTAAKSTSSLQVVYQYFPYLAANPVAINGTLDFYDDLTLSGNVTVMNDNNATTGNFNVKGNIDLSNIGVSGLNTLQATGNVTIGSSASVQTVYANGTVTLKGSANVNDVTALTAINLEAGSGAKANYLKSNGTVTLAAGATMDVNTRGNIVETAAGHGTLTAGGNVSISGWGSITQINSVGTTTMTTGPSVGTINSKGNVICGQVGWAAFTAITTSAIAPTCTGAPAKVKQNTPVSIALIDTLPAFVMTRPTIDVWQLKDAANYVFDYVGGKIQVTVKNINGVADGVYYLGTNGTGKDYLCSTVTAGACVSPPANAKTICQGSSASNACFSYDNSAKKWSVDGKNLAPGIMWFKGNLKFLNGTFYNTFLASGSIEVQGSTKISSSNYVGYNVNCTNTYPVDTSANFSGLYPTNLCNISTTSMKSLPLGNIALVAGGYDPANNGTYTGGDINLSSGGGSNEIFGIVAAGDFLTTGNSTTVHGYITAVALTNDTNSDNSLGNSTTVDLRSLPTTFIKNAIPDMSANPPPREDKAKVLWSRYL